MMLVRNDRHNLFGHVAHGSLRSVAYGRNHTP
jgi:hypothetical protein